ncbi:phage tail tape measure protein [Nocardioides sp. 503]|uniref:phage tail tape measure protein n=1 Tax=Nocardioides sp. 503 TaxID=2508326 RepID=UPI00106FDADB|nr:phage tail tape measure protein [Nocardioides sp. 503]
MAGPIRISILANGKQARAEVAQTSRAFSSLGRSLVRGGAALGITGLIAGTVGLGKASIATEAQFSQRMNLIAAATKAPASELRALNDLAIKLGADTSFSANEAADAMLELAKSGLSPATIQAGALAGTLTLAEAGGTDLATAATVASNALNTFNLQGEDMASVAAAMAGGANASSASIESLAQGLQQVGPGATNAGLSLQETVAALSAFDAAGVKGSDAGTSLKTMLARLVPDNDKAAAAMEALGVNALDAQGNFRSLTDIAGQLQRGMKGLSDAERTRALNAAFGSDASRAAIVLAKEGAGGIRKYIQATNDQNAAQEMAAARMKGTAGATERLSGAMETARLRIGQELAPVVGDVADGLSDNLVPAIEAGIDGAKELGSAVAPAVDAVTDALDGLIPSGDEASSMFEDRLIPAISTLADITAGVVGFVDDLPGPVKDIGVQAGIAALAFYKLSPAITAATTSMRNGAIYAQVLGLEMRNSTSRAALMQGALTKVGGVAKNAAGIGGLMALTSGLTEASDKGLTFGGVMKGAAGGAGIGAMYGPVGALVGAGVGGGLTALVGAFQQTSEEAARARRELMKAEGFKDAEADADSLREALLGVVNAYGKVPRAAIEASFTGKDGKTEKDVQTLRDLGVSMDTIVSATLGQAGAQKIVNDALSAQITDYERLVATYQEAYDNSTGPARVANKEGLDEAKASLQALVDVEENFGKRISENTGAVAEHAAQLKTLAGELGITVAQYKTFPKEVRTRFEAEGLPQTARDAVRLIGQYKGLQNFRSIKAVVSAPGVNLSRTQVERLGKQYRLTPKQIRTVARLEGVAATVKGSERVRSSLRETDKVKVTLPGVKRGVDDAVQGAQKVGGAGAKRVREGIERPLRGTKANLAPWQQSVRAGAFAAVADGRSGSVAVGAAMKAGIQAGFSGTATVLAAQARAAVRAAINAGRAEGKVRSPSKETRYTGEMLGAGLVDGLARREDAARRGGRNIVRELLAGVVNGSEGVESSFGRVDDYIDKVLKKRTKAQQKAARQRLKSVRDERAALTANGRAQDRLQSGNYLGTLVRGSRLWVQMTRLGVKNLEEARQKYKDLAEASTQYNASIQQAFADYGDITNLGQSEDGTVAVGNLLDQLQQRAVAADRYALLIQQLRDAGLNDTSLQDLIDKGPEAGLATAEALISGGSTVIGQVNQLTTQIAQAGGRLGDEMATHFYGAGIQAAAGLVRGLESQAAGLDRVATRLANQMVKAIKKALGIRSPSRVFKDIGDQSVRGLAIGLDDTYARRAGVTLAASLQEGFGVPKLEAMAATSAGGAQGAAALGSLRLTLSAQEIDRLSRGKELIADIDLALDKGARTKNIVVTRSNG